MTTIAYRNGILAGDTRSTYGGTIEASTYRKVRKTRDGRLLGETGNAAIVGTYANALAKGKAELPQIGKDEGFVIEVLPSGDVWIHQHGGRINLGKLRYGAWGSGSDAARGAILMGANAVQAVRIASRIDTNTGGRILSVRL